MLKVLLLGGTFEARQLAKRLAERRDIATTLSLAGRTAEPLAQPVPMRSGGFGGIEGLVHYLRQERIDALVDATHPYAAQMSRHAAAATRMAGVPFLCLHRPAWQAKAGDHWHVVDNVVEAVTALGKEARRVFVTLGRQEIGPFAAAPWHHYLIRSVDAVGLALPHVTYILDRGPFAEADERALLEQHRIEVIVAKNSGGTATYGKIAAARALGLEVVMLDRPALPEGEAVETVDAVFDWLLHRIPSMRGE